jgi:hypothetical protein
MLKDMYEGAVRSYEQGRQLPRVDEQGNYAGTPRAEPLDAFNAASIAPMAGVAGRVTGAIPRGALGSGGSDMLTKAAANDSRSSLPAIVTQALESGDDVAIARALEQAFPNETAVTAPYHIGKYGRDLPLGVRNASEARLNSSGGGRFIHQPDVPPENELFGPLTDYDLSALDQAWRRKVARTGEFFTNPESASLPSLLLQGQDDISTSDILRRYGLLGQ